MQFSKVKETFPETSIWFGEMDYYSLFRWIVTVGVGKLVQPSSLMNGTWQDQWRFLLNGHFPFRGKQKCQILVMPGDVRLDIQALECFFLGGKHVCFFLKREMQCECLLLTGLLVVACHLFVNATDLGALLLARMLGISHFCFATKHWYCWWNRSVWPL